MEFNKDGKVDKYYTLDEILNLDIDENTREVFKKNFGKKVFFDSNGSCKVGTLCGIEKNHKLLMIYYIIEDLEGIRKYVPFYNSITSL